jgi:hypothetical protein
LDSSLLAALPDALVALAALGVYFVRSTAEKSVVEGVKQVHAKLDAVTATLCDLKGDLGISRERLAGEVGKLDIRVNHLERRPHMQSADPLRPAHGGA